MESFHVCETPGQENPQNTFPSSSFQRGPFCAPQTCRQRSPVRQPVPAVRGQLWGRQWCGEHLRRPEGPAVHRHLPLRRPQRQQGDHQRYWRLGAGPQAKSTPWWQLLRTPGGLASILRSSPAALGDLGLPLATLACPQRPWVLVFTRGFRQQPGPRGHSLSGAPAEPAVCPCPVPVLRGVGPAAPWGRQC